MKTALHVLLVEDLEDDMLLLKRELRRGGFEPSIERVETAAEMQEALAIGRWDVVIADYSLPRFNAPAALALLQQSGLDLPFIVVSGTIGEEVAVAVMQAGAHDYILKHNLTRLNAAIEREIRDARVRVSRRNAEAALRFQAHLLDSVEQSVIATDLDGNITFWNSFAEKLFGWRSDEVLGRSILDITPAQMSQAQAADLLEQLSVGRSWTGEFLVRHRSGTSFPAHVTNSPIYDEHGAVAGIVGISIDITARKRAEEVLRTSEQRYRTFARNFPNGAVFLFDHDLRYIVADGLGLGDTGLDRALLEGKTIWDALPPETCLAVEPLYRRILAGEALTVEMPYADHIYIVRGLPVRDEGGAIVAGLVMTQDNTELIAAREAAITASRLKSEFLATVSHELRTPLNGVIGMIELLLGTEVTEEQREYATIVRDSADGLLTVINSILDFSKIEAGSLELDVISFDPALIVEATAESLLRAARAKELSLLTYIAPEIGLLRGDSNRIRQVLLNLLSNAVKFTDHGQIVARVTTADNTQPETYSAAQTRQPPSRTIRFEVSDTGIGISDAGITRLFQPFIQVDGSMARRHGGTGLGLAISKRLVELMGGTIGVHSVEGVGSTFWFTLPLDEPELSHPVARPTDLHGRRLLVVDPDVTNQQIVRRYAEAAGMSVTAAASCAEALAALATMESPCDVMLIELLMPDGDAFGLAQAVWEPEPGGPNIATPAPRLMLMTPFPAWQRGQAALNAGFVDHLRKPLKRDLLEERLGEALALTEPLPDRGRGLHAEAVTIRMNGAPRPSPSAPAPRARILIAEDNPVNRRLVLAQLGKLGVPADAVGNGREAVEAIRRGGYDLVLMDCQMPEMDGFAATAAIRDGETPGQPRLPIVAITANALQGDRERCLAAGMSDYVPKPIQLQALRTILETWLPNTPASEVKAASEPVELALRMPDDSSDPDLSTARPLLLIVDDEVAITRALARRLRDDFSVLTATSGESACALIRQHNIDVVLTDQRMPDMTGVELLRQIKEVSPTTAAVLISGYLDNEALIDALNLGTVRGFVAKPWNFDDLRARLHAARRN